MISLWWNIYVLTSFPIKNNVYQVMVKVVKKKKKELKSKIDIIKITFAC